MLLFDACSRGVQDSCKLGEFGTTSAFPSITCFNTTYAVTGGSAFDSRCHCCINPLGQRDGVSDASSRRLCSNTAARRGLWRSAGSCCLHSFRRSSPTTAESEHTFTASTHLCEIAGLFRSEGLRIASQPVPPQARAATNECRNRSRPACVVEDMLTRLAVKQPRNTSRDTICATISCCKKLSFSGGKPTREIAAAHGLYEEPLPGT